MDIRHGSFLSSDTRNHEVNGQNEHEERFVDTRWKQQAFGVEELMEKGHDGHGETFGSNHRRCFETADKKAWQDHQARDWSGAQIVSYL